MHKITLSTALLSLATFSPVHAGVIQVPNQSPIRALFSVPAAVDFREPDRSVSVQLNVANHYLVRESENELLRLDGETSRLTTQYRQRLSECWTFGAQLPLIHHAGGRLDSFVNQWHKWFDLPESGRPNVANDSLNYQYMVDGKIVLQQSEKASGIGDVSLELTQRQHCGLDGGKVFRAGIKLPTGDPDKLFGSGSANIFADISQYLDNVYASIDVAYTAGFVIMGQSDLNIDHYKQVVYGSLSISMPVTARISLDSQIAVQSPHIKSHLRALSDWPVQLLIGSSFEVSKSLKWNVALSEDPEYGTSSDVVFQLGLVTSF